MEGSQGNRCRGRVRFVIQTPERVLKLFTFPRLIAIPTERKEGEHSRTYSFAKVRRNARLRRSTALTYLVD
jgi:hypothetical protein